MLRRVWVVGAICSVVPDADVIGFRFGVRYGDFWGHRGFTHSILFAAGLAFLAAGFVVAMRSANVNGWMLWLYFFVATASHGLLDALTDGGLGVAFFSPFDTGRYFFPWRPVHVAPISIARFFSECGWTVLKSEIVWIWVPAGILAILAVSLRRRMAGEKTASRTHEV